MVSPLRHLSGTSVCCTSAHALERHLPQIQAPPWIHWRQAQCPRSWPLPSPPALVHRVLAAGSWFRRSPPRKEWGPCYRCWLLPGKAVEKPKLFISVNKTTEMLLNSVLHSTYSFMLTFLNTNLKDIPNWETCRTQNLKRESQRKSTSCRKTKNFLPRIQRWKSRAFHILI